MKFLKILNYSPWLFIISFVIVGFFEIVNYDYAINFKNGEYGNTSIRWFLIGLLYWAVISIFVSIFLNLILFVKKRKVFNSIGLFFYLLGIFILATFLIFNPFYLFTWLMG